MPSEVQAGIHADVQQIGEQVDDQHEDPEEDGEPLDDREVPGGHRVDEQAAQSGYGEDVLDDDGAADQEGEVDAEHHDERQQRVRQDVAPQHSEPGQPL